MSRAQQGAVLNQATDVSKTNQAEAQKSEATEQQDINNQQSQLAKFAANNPYVQGGALETATNKQIAGTADATAAAAAAKEQALAQRTGQNPAAAVAAGEAEQQAAQRTLGTQEAGATESRLAAGAKYGQDVLGAGAGITAEQARLSALQSGASQGALSTEEQAAQTPSFMDQLGTGLIQGGIGVGEAYCPAEGALYLMADGTEIPVEVLAVGDDIMGVDGESQRINFIESIEAPIVQVVTADGQITRVSLSHAFSLPFGGFTEACRSFGKTVRTRTGCPKILSVKNAGVARVYNVVTNGSHTYRADGIWGVGMGEMERVSRPEKRDKNAEQAMART